MEDFRTIPDTSRGHVLIATTVACLALDFLFVGLRTWSRRIQRTKHRLDDFLIIAALVMLTGLSIVVIYSVEKGGTGHHIQFVSDKQLIQWLKSALIAAPILNFASAALSRLAVLHTYLTVYRDRSARLCCWAIVFLLTAQPIICLIVVLLQCQPLNFLWNKTLLSGQCIDPARMLRYGTLPNIPIDVAILVLPLPLIRKLQVSTKSKLGLLVTFLSGSIGLITAILRFVAFFSSQIVDGTWSSVEHLGWAIIEPSVYLMAACLLAFRPLLRHLSQEIIRSKGNHRSWPGFHSARYRNMVDTEAPANQIAMLPGHGRPWGSTGSKNDKVSTGPSTVTTKGSTNDSLFSTDRY